MSGTNEDDDSSGNPGGMFADKGDAQNGKSRDWVKGAGMGGTKAQDHADRRDKGGPEMADNGPLGGALPPSD